MKTKIAKIVSGILIIAILLPGFLFALPNQAEAVVGVPVNDYPQEGTSVLQKGIEWSDLGFSIKEWALQTLKIAISAIIQRLIQEMTNSIVNWINGGFHGSPLFLENPESFFKDIVKFEIQTMIDQIGYDLTRFPFGKDWALNVINAYKSTLERNAAHSLSSVMGRQEIAAYMDFNVGGWNSFFLETQYPSQNSYVGSQIMMTESLSSKLTGAIQAPAEQVTKLLDQGMGFLSPQVCMDDNGNNNYNNNIGPWRRPSFHCTIPEPDCTRKDPSTGNIYTDLECRDDWEAQCNEQQQQYNSENYCKNLTNTTPGSVVASKITTSLTSSERLKEYGAVVGTFEAGIATIIDTLINKLITDGLIALTGGGSEETEDNWTYNGLSLDDDNTGGGDGAGPMDIPQNVSVQVGEASSIEITGGKAPYTIKSTDPITPNSNIATASLSGTNLTITGVGPGTTTVTINDSRQTPKPRQVKITITVVTDGSLMIVPANITVEVGDSQTATIYGGEKPYRITASPESSITDVLLSDNILVITGIGAGETSITISDSSAAPKTATAGITIGSTSTLGSCTLSTGDVMQNLTEAECNTLGGTWSGNNSQAGDVTVSLTSDKNLVDAGERFKLSWEATNTIENNPCSAWWTSKNGSSGSKTFDNGVQETTIFQMTCYGENGGSGTGSITIQVEADET